MSKTDKTRPQHDVREHSRLVVDTPKQTPRTCHVARGRLRRRGLRQAADRHRLHLGNLTPCNMHIDELAKEAVAGADEAGGKGVLFNTITVSDGISMGTPGMRYSLVSREVIADSIETVVGAQGFDGRDRHRRLRQEHARLRDGDRPAEPAGGLRLWRHHPARQNAARHRLGVRGGRGACERHASATNSCTRSSARRFPGPAAAAACTRPIPWPPRSRRSACRCPDSSAQEAVSRQQTHRLPPRRRGRMATAQGGITPERHPDAQGLRERDHDDDRAGGLDQRGAAPARHRARGAGEAVDRRLHAHRQARAGAGRRPPERPLPHVRTDRDRRHPAADENACCTRVCSTATA